MSRCVQKKVETRLQLVCLLVEFTTRERKEEKGLALVDIGPYK